MRRPHTLPAFTKEERIAAHRLLAAQVVSMMGRKLEEGDWTYVYCAAKNIPHVGWSNLNIDVTHGNLGVEQKMLSRPSNVRMLDVCGTPLMHPSLTRSIRIPPTEEDPNRVMRDVFTQYADLILARRSKVAERSSGLEPDMRIGWLLWQPSLREFLYFEQEMIAPDPDDYWAEWKESSGGRRKASKNLWVYEKEAGHKRYSITTAGPKIQPYFDVPPPSDPNVYIFRVQGEELRDGLIRIWVAEGTEQELHRLIGDMSVDNVSLVISNAAIEPAADLEDRRSPRATALPLLLTAEAYNLLTASFPGVSDEHMIQLLIRRLRSQ